MFRVEDKYIVEPDKMMYLEKRVEILLDRDQNSGDAGYKISSLYFDDIYNSCAEDVMSGNSYKDKFRIRIYNDSFDVIKLEVKKKLYNRTKKLSSTITVGELSSLFNGDVIFDNDGRDEARAQFNLAILTRGIRPKVIVTYDRNAYIYAAGNVRITFDRDVRYSGNIDLFGKDFEYEYPYDYNNVVEVKYDEMIPRLVMQTIESGNLTQSSNSKYGMCINELTGRK